METKIETKTNSKLEEERKCDIEKEGTSQYRLLSSTDSTVLSC